MLLSDLPVHREQAPGARFFDVDDAAGLAEAIVASPVRSSAQIAAAGHEARLRNTQSQKDFAQSLSSAVRSVADAARPV